MTQTAAGRRTPNWARNPISPPVVVRMERRSPGIARVALRSVRAAAAYRPGYLASRKSRGKVFGGGGSVGGAGAAAVRAFASRRWQRAIIFFTQRGARRIGRRWGNAGARRRVERTLAPACCESERCHHGGHQGQPAPSVDGLLHLHPTLSPRLRAEFGIRPANGRTR